MENLKKIGAFFALFAILVGAGCGIGMNFAFNNPFAGICCIILTLASVPTFIALLKYLLK